MTKSLSLPIFIIIMIVYAVGMVSILTYIFDIIELPSWSLIFPSIFFMFYTTGLIIQLSPKKLKGTLPQRLSTLTRKDRMIYWFSTLMVSAISIAEGFFFGSIRYGYGILLAVLSFLLWIGIQRIASKSLRDAMIKME